MSERINRETGCRYARFDGIIANGDVPVIDREAEHVPSWFGAQIYCIKHQDSEAAELIRTRNRVIGDLYGE